MIINYHRFKKTESKVLYYFLIKVSSNKNFKYGKRFRSEKKGIQVTLKEKLTTCLLDKKNDIDQESKIFTLMTVIKIRVLFKKKMGKRMSFWRKPLSVFSVSSVELMPLTECTCMTFVHEDSLCREK